MNLFNPVMKLVQNHYNNTNTYGFYNMETNKYELMSYTEPVKDIIITDVITVGLLYYVLTNL